MASAVNPYLSRKRTWRSVRPHQPGTGRQSRFNDLNVARLQLLQFQPCAPIRMERPRVSRTAIRLSTAPRTHQQIAGVDVGNCAAPAAGFARFARWTTPSGHRLRRGETPEASCPPAGYRLSTRTSVTYSRRRLTSLAASAPSRTGSSRRPISTMYMMPSPQYDDAYRREIEETKCRQAAISQNAGRPGCWPASQSTSSCHRARTRKIVESTTSRQESSSGARCPPPPAGAWLSHRRCFMKADSTPQVTMIMAMIPASAVAAQPEHESPQGIRNPRLEQAARHDIYSPNGNHRRVGEPVEDPLLID